MSHPVKRAFTFRGAYCDNCNRLVDGVIVDRSLELFYWVCD